MPLDTCHPRDDHLPAISVSAHGSCDIHDTLNITQLGYYSVKCLYIAYIKSERYRSSTRFAGAHIHRLDIDLVLGEDLGYTQEHTGTILGVNIDLGREQLLCLALGIIPLSRNKSHAFVLGEIDDIDTIGTMYGYASTSRYKAYDLITRYGRTALGEMYGYIVDTLYDDRALGGIESALLLRHLGDRIDHLGISHLTLVLLLIFLDKLADDLTFLESAMTHGSIYGIPVLISVFTEYRLLEISFHDICQNNTLGLTVVGDEFLTLEDVLLLELRLEPLIDLVLSLRRLDKLQPVTRRSLGIL